MAATTMLRLGCASVFAVALGACGGGGGDTPGNDSGVGNDAGRLDGSTTPDTGAGDAAAVCGMDNAGFLTAACLPRCAPATTIEVSACFAGPTSDGGAPTSDASVDGGLADGSLADAGEWDSGQSDAGVADAGVADAAAPDGAIDGGSEGADLLACVLEKVAADNTPGVALGVRTINCQDCFLQQTVACGIQACPSQGVALALCAQQNPNAEPQTACATQVSALIACTDGLTGAAATAHQSCLFTRAFQGCLPPAPTNP